MIAQKAFKRFNAVVIILILLFVLVVFQSDAYAQESKTVQYNQSENHEDIIRVDTNLVTVPATVFDRHGRYVTNLKKEDFQIFEDGVEEEIALFEPVEQKFTVLLLLDVSGSMFNDLGSLTNAASTFLNQLRPNDQVMVATFNEWVDVLFDFKSVEDLRSEKKLRFKIDGRPPVTMIYDAVEFGLKKMKKIRGRKAIILFSDGLGSGYRASVKSTLRDAEENEAIIYTVQFDTFSETLHPHVNKKAAYKKYYKDLDVANNYMRDLAQATGGRKYQIEDIVNLGGTFAQIAAELGRQYSLGYYPKESEVGQKRQIRQIKVKMRQPNLVVRARNSYVMEPQKKNK